MSRTLSGLFLVGALNRPRKRKGTNRENPRTIPEQIGKIPEKSGKSQKAQKRTEKEGRVQIGKPPPRLKHPRLAALDQYSLEFPDANPKEVRKHLRNALGANPEIPCVGTAGSSQITKDSTSRAFPEYPPLVRLGPFIFSEVAF